jgi:transcriptional regulator GlxA family with amidase domain
MLTMLRIERARELLQKEPLSIKEVSSRTGFSNSNYFAKVFRRITGQSPSEFQLGQKGRKGEGV